jgi:hypothetical protein
MSTQDEREDLKENPLPVQSSDIKSVSNVDYVTGCPSSLVLTRILLIDDEMNRINDEIMPYLTSLSKQRETLLKRAINEKITSDDDAMIAEKYGKQMRNHITDIPTFKAKFPDAYTKIRLKQLENLNDDYNKSLKMVKDSEIPLGIADDILGKAVVTEYTGVLPVKTTYEVVRKPKPLKLGKKAVR